MISPINAVLAATVNANLPGPYSVSGAHGSGPVAIIGNLYYFSLALGGMLAFGSIVYAGIKWTTSRGNVTAVGDARDRITQAVLGLLLLFGAYLIMRTINPELTVLKIQPLSPLSNTPPAAGGPTCGNPPSNQGTCNAGSACIQDRISHNWSCIQDSYVYCGNRKSDGTISLACPSGQTCTGAPDYQCKSPTENKQYYGCVNGDGTQVTCNGSPVATKETLSECRIRCANLSGTTCAARPDICNP